MAFCIAKTLSGENCVAVLLGWSELSFHPLVTSRFYWAPVTQLSIRLVFLGNDFLSTVCPFYSQLYIYQGDITTGCLEIVHFQGTCLLFVSCLFEPKYEAWQRPSLVHRSVEKTAKSLARRGSTSLWLDVNPSLFLEQMLLIQPLMRRQNHQWQDWWPVWMRKFWSEPTLATEFLAHATFAARCVDVFVFPIFWQC